MESKNINYLPALDHIRAYAALLAVFYHGLQLFWHQEAYGELFRPTHWLAVDNPLLAVIVEGHTAVALFMVLSGFIFTYGARGRNVVYHRFIFNRFLRTYPLFLVLIVVGLSVLPQNFNWQALLTTLFSFANMPNHLNVPPFSAMFWAVSVEWHFYLLFPFLLLFLNQYGRGYLLGLILLFLLFRLMGYLLTDQTVQLSYFTIVGRMDQFLIGMLAGYWCSQGSINRIKSWSFPLSGLLAVMILYFFHRTGGWPVENPYRILWTTLEGMVWALFLVSYLSFARLIPEKLSRGIASVGIISYSVYLIHFVIIYLLVTKGWYLDFGLSVIMNALLNTLILALPSTLLISALSYYLIERPFLRLRTKYYR